MSQFFIDRPVFARVIAILDHAWRHARTQLGIESFRRSRRRRSWSPPPTRRRLTPPPFEKTVTQQ